jgi:hypothetical protein
MQHSLSPIDADTGTVMRHSHTSGSQILVNIAHIGKVKFCVWNVKLQHVVSACGRPIIPGVSDEQT